MRFDEWSPIYESILSDMGYDRSSDEASARLLKVLMLNADLMTVDELSSMIGDEVSIFGAAKCLESDVEKISPSGTLISAGSATVRVMAMGIMPDIVVTDLDGDIDSQIQASERGAVTLIHAHGDNADLIARYAKEFRGRVVLTTQSSPDNILYDFGGFTDGDRAVCLARHFGSSRIRLYGFDFDDPYPGDGKDLSIKSKKLKWAKRLIGDGPDLIR